MKHIATTLLAGTLGLCCLPILSGCEHERSGPLDPPEAPTVLTVETEQAGCSVGGPGAASRRTSLKARPDVSGKLRVWISGYDYYCSPSPSFVAEVDPDGGLVIDEAPLPPDAKPSRCTCAHNVVFTIQGLATGSYDIILLPRGRAGSPAPLAEANVTMP